MADMSLLEVLYRPWAYFRERTPELSVERTVLIFALVIIGISFTTTGIGWTFANHVDTASSPGGATADNASCADGFGNGTGNISQLLCANVSSQQGGPSIGQQIRSSYLDQLPLLLLSRLFTVVFIGLLFHGLSSLVGGSGTFKDTINVAVMGHLPLLIGGVASLIAAFLFVRVAPVTPPIGAVTRQIQLFTGVVNRPVNILFHTVIVVWQGTIWASGLYYARGVPRHHAGGIAGVAVLVTFFGLFV